MTSGAEPMRRPRDERFAQLLAGAGTISLLDAWIESSAEGVKPDPSPSLRVTASRAGKRVADRVAYLKRQRAAESAPSEPLTAERLSALMASTTAALLDAANAAQFAGADSIAQHLRKTITVHAGRSARVERRAPSKERKTGVVDIDAVLARLFPCRCEG